MERQRQIKILSIVALVVAIAGMSLGFAAFSATLNISSNASVTPDSGDFEIQLCNDDRLNYCDEILTDYVAYYYEYGGAINNYGDVGGNVAFFKMTFTKPGQAIEYKFYAQNVGKYDAYLRSVFFESLEDGSYKRCSASTTDETKATDTLVQAACDGINISVSIDGIQQAISPYGIFGHKLAKQTVEEIKVKFEYEADAAYVDGPFNVEFGKLEFYYSTVDGVSKLISFTISGVTYQAEEGMTWKSWIDSDYNVDGYYIDEYSKITVGDGEYVMYVDTSNVDTFSVIEDSYSYYYGTHNGSSND